MQITAICPSCQSRYQLTADLLGQKIRCPNAACREVFEVREMPAEKPKPAKAKPARDRRAPSFDDVPTEKIGLEDPRATGPRAADWSAMPPPPVRRRDEPVAEPVAAAAEPAPAASDEVLAWMMSAPDAPVSEGSDEIYSEPAAPVAEEGYASYDALTEYAPQPRRSWAKWAVLFLFLIAAGGVGGGLWYVSQRNARQERELSIQAAAAIEGHQFPRAAKLYDDLITNSPKSKDLQKYKFLKEYATAQDAAYAIGPPEKRREEFSQYITKTAQRRQLPAHV